MPGEAVTILAPLVEAVAELHRAGVAHGALRLSNVLFDEAGAPVLVGFGAAVLLGPAQGQNPHAILTPAQLSENEAATADLKGLARLCRSVLENTLGVRSLSAAGALYECLDSASAHLDADAFPLELTERLFALAEPIAVRAEPRTVESPPQPGRPLRSPQPSADTAEPDLPAPAGVLAVLRGILFRPRSSARRPVLIAGVVRGRSARYQPGRPSSGWVIKRVGQRGRDHESRTAHRRASRRAGQRPGEGGAGPVDTSRRVPAHGVPVAACSSGSGRLGDPGERRRSHRLRARGRGGRPAGPGENGNAHPTIGGLRVDFRATAERRSASRCWQSAPTAVGGSGTSWSAERGRGSARPSRWRSF